MVRTTATPAAGRSAGDAAAPTLGAHGTPCWNSPRDRGRCPPRARACARLAPRTPACPARPVAGSRPPRLRHAPSLRGGPRPRPVHRTPARHPDGPSLRGRRSSDPRRGWRPLPPDVARSLRHRAGVAPTGLPCLHRRDLGPSRPGLPERPARPGVLRRSPPRGRAVARGRRRRSARGRRRGPPRRAEPDDRVSLRDGDARRARHSARRRRHARLVEGAPAPWRGPRRRGRPRGPRHLAAPELPPAHPDAGRPASPGCRASSWCSPSPSATRGSTARSFP
jgi:hypothetical protein